MLTGETALVFPIVLIWPLVLSIRSGAPSLYLQNAVNNQ